MTVFLFLFSVLILFLILWSRPRSGLYLAVFLAPFLGLVLDFSHYQWARGIPFLRNIDAPLADFVVLILFGAMAGRMIWDGMKHNISHPPLIPPSGRGGQPSRPPRSLIVALETAGFFYFLPFLLVGLLSLFNVPYDQFNGSLKYLLRPILFFYLMWVILPVHLIDSEKILDKVIKIVFWTGVLAALMGFISLFVNPSIFGFWRRAAPLEFWGIAPLAFNHNLLAEVLVTAAPLGFYLFVAGATRRVGGGGATHRVAPTMAKLYFFGFILITVIALLTFARAAWLALGAEAVVYYWCYRRPFLSRHPEGASPKDLSNRKEILPLHFVQGQNDGKRTPLLLFLIIIPLLIYMFFFSISPIVQSSNATRLDLTGISWTYFKLHPWLGNGVGTFIPLVEQTRLFTVEYGDPLDAHGVLQKLAAEEGLLGLLTFFLFVGWIIHRLYSSVRRLEKEHRLLLLCLFLSVIGGLVYQLFNTSYYNAHLWLAVGVALAGVRALARKSAA